MATRSVEERLAELEKKEAQLKAQKRALKSKASAEARKKRTKRLIEIGGAVESICHIDFDMENGDLEKLIAFLKSQEKNGYYFSKAMGYSHTTNEAGEVVYSKISENN